MSFEFIAPKYCDLLKTTPFNPSKNASRFSTKPNLSVDESSVASPSSSSSSSSSCSISFSATEAATNKRKLVSESNHCSKRAKINPQNCHLTRVHPFALCTEARAEARSSNVGASQNAEYVPLCKQVAKFVEETPPRFKRVPIPAAPAQPLESTIPKPFHLSTSRIRYQVAPQPISTCFKATTLNPKLFTSTPVGVPVVSKKPCTTPKDFSFLKREQKQSADPVPSAFQFKAQPIPNFAEPWTPKLVEQKTEPQPFNLHANALKTRSQNQEVSSTAQFKAHPFPAWASSCPPSSPRNTKPVTKLEPFANHSDKRAVEHQSWLNLKKENAQKEEMFAALKDQETKENDAASLKIYRRSLFIKARPNPFPLQAPRADRSTCYASKC